MTKDKVAAAYQRGELFDLRLSMMAKWDDFLFQRIALARLGLASELRT